VYLASGSHRYQVGNKVADAGSYRLYLCTQEETDRQCLLQIATEATGNGGLDRAAYLLQELARRAEEIEAEYAQVKSDPKDMLNYELGFPELVDSFVCPEQGGRRVNTLAFRFVEEISRMVPINNITERDRLRVDLKTSAWIMGKLLKLLVFTHGERILIRQMTGNNILIEPDEHYVVIFDLSQALTYQEEIPEDVRRQEIELAARSVIVVLGGDPVTGTFPDDGDDCFDQYTSHILRLASGGPSNAARAHAQFYQLIHEMGWHGFHPFTTLPL